MADDDRFRLPIRLEPNGAAEAPAGMWPVARLRFAGRDVTVEHMLDSGRAICRIAMSFKGVKPLRRYRPRLRRTEKQVAQNVSVEPDLLRNVERRREDIHRIFPPLKR